MLIFTLGTGHEEAIAASSAVLSDLLAAGGLIRAARWGATDEWYDFSRDPGVVDGVKILATVDETSYSGGAMRALHPVIWAHERLGGRALYSAPGHSEARWSEATYVAHIVATIAWVAGD